MSRLWLAIGAIFVAVTAIIIFVIFLRSSDCDVYIRNQSKFFRVKVSDQKLFDGLTSKTLRCSKFPVFSFGKLRFEKLPKSANFNFSDCKGSLSGWQRIYDPTSQKLAYGYKAITDNTSKLNIDFCVSEEKLNNDTENNSVLDSYLPFILSTYKDNYALTKSNRLLKELRGVPSGLVYEKL